MSDSLQKLVGRKVTDAEIVHDYIQIGFDGSCGLSIFNEYDYSGHSLSELVDKKVLFIKENSENIIFGLSDGTRLIIDMRASAYSGPEALNLWLPESRLPIVWN